MSTSMLIGGAVATVDAQSEDPSSIEFPQQDSGFEARLDAYREFANIDTSESKVDKALKEFASALDLVVNDAIVDESAFLADARGIQFLEQSSVDAATVERIAASIAAADRVAAEFQISMAQIRLAGVDAALIGPTVQNHLDQADRAIETGDKARDRGKFAQAVRHYRHAWIAAFKALVDISEDIDADRDLIPANLEAELGLDPDNPDTDGDGLADIEEIWMTFTDPSLASTDGVTNDADLDPDADGLGNARELGLGSDPLVPDTDGDSLSDGAEVDSHGTDPTLVDTDADRLDDDSELRVGTDPLNPDTDGDGILDGDETYTTSAAFTTTGVQVEITGVGDIAPTVSLLNESPADWLQDLPGLASPVIDLTTPQPFDEAGLTIPFDPAVAEGDFAGIGIMFFDEELGTWVPLPAERAVVDPAGTVTAFTDHFTLFAVFYIPNWQAVLDAFDPDPGTGAGGGDVFVDIALVLDSSGSMAWNDPSGLRRTASKSFIDALIEGDQVAVVDFDFSATLLQGLTTDFAAAKAAVDRVDSSGGTNIGAGVSVANNELINNGDPDHGRVQIVLTDGEGAYNQSLTQQAIDNDIVIYTIGLGSSVDAALLTGIAEATGGQYFAVANAEDLPEVFSRIDVNLDPAGDEDLDGIPNGTEMNGAITGTGQTYYLDPRDPDTDGDGLMDGDEIKLGTFSTLYAYYIVSDPTSVDSDGDGLTDGDELEVSLNPLGSDWDRDGLSDGVEVFTGFDPRDGNPDDDSYGDFEELEQGSDPFTYDLDGPDQARAFIAGALLGEFGSRVPAFSFKVKELAGELVDLAPNVPYVSDGLRNIVNGVNGAITGLGCGVNSVAGWINPFGGGPADLACDVLNFTVKYDPAYAESLSYLGGWIALSLIPFLDIVASVRDLVGALLNGDWVGAGLEVIFGVLGFLAPIAGDIPGTAGKVVKFLVRAPEKAGAVLKFLIKNASGKLDEVLRPLIKRIWDITDDQIARVGGMAKVAELGDEFVNTKKLTQWLARNSDNAITKASVDSDQVLDAVRRNWDEAPGDAASQRIRNLAAEAVSTEAAVKILESRGYDVLYVSRNIPFDVGDDIRRTIVNGPDIIARAPNQRPVIIEVKGSNQDKLRIGESTITNSAGVQTSRDWLLDASGTRYRNTLEQAAAIDETGRLAEARDIIDEILGGTEYDVIIAGASEQTVFSGGLENALLKLDNGGATEVLEIDVPRALLDDAIDALTP